MEIGKNIEFNQSKNFKFVRKLGSGGTGVTNLFKDETTDTLFAIKKYQPAEGNMQHEEDYYQRFIEEIVILFKLSHPNIVRVYNYYLYPNLMTGYLQMEYIEGVSIDDYVKSNSKDLDKLFRSAVNSFECLEENDILHRDIRPENIMIDNNGDLKIIDFGFGKVLSDTNTENSIILNWPVTDMPNEVLNDRDYTVATEIYFLGSLFKKLVQENNIENYKFTSIINKMCESNIEKRYQSFKDILLDITKGVLLGTDFPKADKIIYQNMATSLTSMISEYQTEFSAISDVREVQINLEKVISNSSLEENIQDNRALIECFISNDYKFYPIKTISVDYVKQFYKLLLDNDYRKRNIIIDNLMTRLSLIRLNQSYIDISDDDLPF